MSTLAERMMRAAGRRIEMGQRWAVTDVAACSLFCEITV